MLSVRRRDQAGLVRGDDEPALIFDEPFNGMDPEGIVWMKGFLRSLAAQGRAVLTCYSGAGFSPALQGGQRHDIRLVGLDQLHAQ